MVLVEYKDKIHAVLSKRFHLTYCNKFFGTAEMYEGDYYDITCRRCLDECD